MGDDDATTRSVGDRAGRLGVEQPSAETSGSLADHQSVHPHRPRCHRCAEAGGAELQPTGEPAGELGGVAGPCRCDQRRELVTDVGVWLGVEPRGGGANQVVGARGKDSESAITDQITQLDQRTRPDMADHLGRSDRAVAPARLEIATRCQTVQESSREQIAGAGRVDDSLDRSRREPVAARRASRSRSRRRRR